MHLLVGFLLSAFAAPQGDNTVVEFHIPSQFEQALETARNEKRLLLIKGVAFGVDEVGAQCATKGRW